MVNEQKLRDLQLKDLEIAKYFIRFCDSNNLLCYFCGGGCIGAIRHKGFIPWDDDLDFFMPRDSYEKLKLLWKQEDHKPYVLLYLTESYNDHNIFMTLRDTSTTMIKSYQANLDIPHGVAVDIFPLDGCPSSFLKRKVQLFWALVYQLYGAQLVPENHGKVVQWIGRILLSVVKSPKARCRIWKYAENKMSETRIEDCQYITELCAGPKYMHNKYPKELFSRAIMADFENTKVPIPVGYDAYLRQAFGNYMELPAVDKRHPSHDVSIIDLENSYTKYTKL